MSSIDRRQPPETADLGGVTEITAGPDSLLRAACPGRVLSTAAVPRPPEQVAQRAHAQGGLEE